MNSPDEFDEMMGQAFAADPINNTPYGRPAQPVKPGLTKRGKAALAIGATVIAGGGLMFYQHNSAVESANAVKAQELALQKQQLELEKLKELGKVNAAQQKTQATADAARQKQIDACVQENKGLVGKQLGATYSSVLEDCQNQYAATSGSGDMQEAASTSDAGTGGGGISPGLLLGIGAGGALIVGFAANRGKNRNAA